MPTELIIFQHLQESAEKHVQEKTRALFLGKRFMCTISRGVVGGILVT